MAGGPEVACSVAEFELSCTLRKEERTDICHHEQTPAFQKRFMNHVNSATEEFRNLRNPLSNSYVNNLVKQTRDSELNTFFSHENSATQCSLVCDNKIRSGVKADLLPCFKMPATIKSFMATNNIESQSICTTDKNDNGQAKTEVAKVILTVPENVDGKVLEGSVLVYLLKPTKQNIIAEYARTVFVPKETKEM